MDREDQSVSTVTRRPKLNPSSCNQVRLFVQGVIKFQHTTIHSCLHGSIVDSLLNILKQTFHCLLLSN